MITRVLGYTALLAGAGLAGLVAAEAAMARSRRYARPELGLNLRASIGEAEAPPLRVVLLGDSSAAGVGVETFADTVGGQLADLLAADGVRVLLSSVAVSGARSVELATQVARSLLGPTPHLAVILIGANDTTRLVGPETAAAQLGAAVRRLGRAGVSTVVGTCPDLGAARAVAQPLRYLLGQLGNRVAAAQERAVRHAGGVVVPLAERTGTLFRADPGMLCWDGYHPSAEGYRLWASELAPACRTALRAHA